MVGYALVYQNERENAFFLSRFDLCDVRERFHPEIVGFDFGRYSLPKVIVPLSPPDIILHLRRAALPCGDAKRAARTSRIVAVAGGILGRLFAGRKTVCRVSPEAELCSRPMFAPRCSGGRAYVQEQPLV